MSKFANRKEAAAAVLKALKRIAKICHKYHLDIYTDGEYGENHISFDDDDEYEWIIDMVSVFRDNGEYRRSTFAEDLDKAIEEIEKDVE